MPPATVTSEQNATPVAAGEIRVEVCMNKNEQLLFPPLKKSLRGRWEIHNLNRGDTFDSEHSALGSIDTIDGLYICLDIAARRARIVDPLSLSDTRHIAQLDAVRKFRRPDIRAIPTQEVSLPDDNQIATWVHWIRVGLENGYCVMVPGSAEVPEKVAGRAKLDVHNSNPLAPKFQDELQAQARGEWKGDRRR